MASRKKPSNPDEAELRTQGLGYPETTEDFPWDHRALKVRGKVFAFMGTGAEGGASDDRFFLTCKLPETHPIALTLEGVEPTGYGLGKSGWVTARYPRGKAPVAMLREWLQESYCAVAPKKLAAIVAAGVTPPPSPPRKRARSRTTPSGRRPPR